MSVFRRYPRRSPIALFSNLLSGSLMAAALLLASLTLPLAAATTPKAPPTNFGPNVYVFDPSMSVSDIQTTVDSISTQQIPNQFGTQRYLLLFMPGTYGSTDTPLNFQVGYYEAVAGLGQNPTDTVINGSINSYNQCDSSGCNATDNFWRSLSNLTINVTNPTFGCYTGEFWAVSQASPIRRVQVNGNATFMDYCTGPSDASGGFTSDSSFVNGSIVSGSQQQWIIRNSVIDSWSNGVWNQVFSGVTNAPAQCFPAGSCGGPYTTLATSPVTRESPYLYLDSNNNYNVFVSSSQTNSSGTTWANGPTAGRSIPIGSFFIANPKNTAAQMNNALANGKNLILTPGVYNLNQAIKMIRPDTVVLGLGYPTLIPQRGNAAMVVASEKGMIVSGIMIDAGPVNSQMLLQYGSNNHGNSDSADPGVISDVFFRIGGAEAGSANLSLVVNNSDAILDDVWAWRADHGTGVGWTLNTANTGLVVNGIHTTAYGLFVEHYQKYEVQWNATGGTVIFFQNEMPYDPPSQDAWMEAPGVDGYAAFKVSNNVAAFQGYGMGSYSFFNQGVNIYAANAFEVPNTLAAGSMNDLLTVFLSTSGFGGILNVIDNSGGSSTIANPDVPVTVVSYP